MANLVQLRMLEDLDGYLLVDKPAGISFSTVVKTIKRKFNLVKVGHGGSLDTQASGLLILLINDANKFVDRVMNADREYEGSLDFSYMTNTGDSYGAKVEGGHRDFDLAEFKGDIFQIEPKFAAVKKDNAAGYEVVDTGEHQQLLGHVYKFEFDGEGERRKFSLKATKNVIPRAMALEMGATLTSLRRTKIGRFDVAEAVPFDKLLETEIKDFAQCVMPLAKALQ